MSAHKFVSFGYLFLRLCSCLHVTNSSVDNALSRRRLRSSEDILANFVWCKIYSPCSISDYFFVPISQVLRFPRKLYCIELFWMTEILKYIGLMITWYYLIMCFTVLSTKHKAVLTFNHNYIIMPILKSMNIIFLS